MNSKRHIFAGAEKWRQIDVPFLVEVIFSASEVEDRAGQDTTLNVSHTLNPSAHLFVSLSFSD